ncbi:MAG: hypothetical protein ILP24_01415 [Paludibacteraceae bacterium]|nr:hypothetical protein [Paludibacteraceae bacterium]
MKKITFFMFATMLAFATSFTFVSCGDDDEDDLVENDPKVIISDIADEVRNHDEYDATFCFDFRKVGAFDGEFITSECNLTEDEADKVVAKAEEKLNYSINSFKKEN